MDRDTDAALTAPSNPKLIVTIRAQFATIKDPQPPINSSGGRVAHAAITRTRVTRAVFCYPNNCTTTTIFYIRDSKPGRK